METPNEYRRKMALKGAVLIDDDAHELESGKELLESDLWDDEDEPGDGEEDGTEGSARLSGERAAQKRNNANGSHLILRCFSLASAVPYHHEEDREKEA
jgi:hypothetical protein